jgi:hypothetical protein
MGNTGAGMLHSLHYNQQPFSASKMVVSSNMNLHSARMRDLLKIILFEDFSAGSLLG